MIARTHQPARGTPTRARRRPIRPSFQRRKHSLAGLWGCCAALCGSIIVADFSPVVGLRILGAASIVFGLAVFVAHGGRLITGAGIYCLAAGTFLGSASIYYSYFPAENVNTVSLLWAAVWGYATTGAMYVGWWRRTRPPNVVLSVPYPGRVPLWGLTVGIALLAVGLILRQLNVDFGGIPDATAFDGALLVATSILLVRGQSRLSALRVIVAGTAFAAYFFGSFTGGGRLLLVSLALAIVVSIQTRTPLRRQKAWVLLASVPALLLFGLIGRSRVPQAAEIDVAAGGLISVVNPLEMFAEMLDRKLDGGGVEIMIANALVLVPRDLWPGKPVGFGRAAAMELRPAIASRSDNFTIAALNQGEWYYVGGVAALILMVPVVGAVVTWLDRRLTDGSRDRSYMSFMSSIAVGLLGAGLADLAWVGPYTWIGRTVIRLVVLSPLFWWAWLRRADR